MHSTHSEWVKQKAMCCNTSQQSRKTTELKKKSRRRGLLGCWAVVGGNQRFEDRATSIFRVKVCDQGEVSIALLAIIHVNAGTVFLTRSDVSYGKNKFN
jgi:hypothetical protein